MMKACLTVFLFLGLMAAAQAQSPADINVAEPNAAAPNTDQMNNARTIPAQPNPAGSNVAQPNPAWSNTDQMNNAATVPAWMNQPDPNVAEPNVD